MADLKQAVHAVENDLRPAVYIAGRPKRGMALRERMAHYNVPGFSIALVDGNEIAWAKGYGVQESGGRARVTGETLFQAASISKSISAMAALSLVQQGVLDLDSDVNRALRSWRVPENEHTGEHKVTLRGLLSHTAGLTVSGYRGYAPGEAVPSVRQVLDGEPPANSDPVRVMHEPGSAFSYSGGGYTVLQQLLEDVTGEPFAGLVGALVLDKLGMAHSTTQQPLPKAYTAQAASGHRGNGQPLTAPSVPDGPTTPAPGAWHTYPEQAAAGLWTTPSDLARYVVEVHKSRAGRSNVVLSAEMIREMLAPPPDGRYGLGLWIIEGEGWTRFEHPGTNEGYRAYMGGTLGTGQGVAWMANGDNGELLGKEVLRALGWPGFEPLEKAVVQPDLTLYARYVGRYQFSDAPDWGARIVQANDRLYWESMPPGERYELYPASDTTFFCLEHPYEITFVRDVGGKVEAIQFGGYARLEPVDGEA